MKDETVGNGNGEGLPIEQFPVLQATRNGITEAYKALEAAYRTEYEYLRSLETETFWPWPWVKGTGNREGFQPGKVTEEEYFRSQFEADFS